MKVAFALILVPFVPEYLIADYAEISGKLIDAIRASNGKQPGDPAKAAIAMIQVVESDDPPLRLALGGDTVNGIAQKLDAMKSELEAWKSVSTSTAFVGAAAN